MTGAGAAPDVTPGVVPAWAVTFIVDPPGSPDPFTVGSTAYDGSVMATLPSGLSGGSYQIVIEGMTDADYGKLRARRERRAAAGGVAPVVAGLIHQRSRRPGP